MKCRLGNCTLIRRGTHRDEGLENVEVEAHNSENATFTSNIFVHVRKCAAKHREKGVPEERAYDDEQQDD